MEENICKPHIYDKGLISKMTDRNMKRCSTSPIIRKMQIKTIMKYHLRPVSIVIFKETRDNRCWEGCGEKGILIIVDGNVN